MRIVGYHLNEKGILANSDHMVTQEGYLDFLLEPKPDALKVFYHLNYAVANLLKVLGFNENELKALNDTKQLYKEGFKFLYVPGKAFSIKDPSRDQNGDRPFVNFSDMSQYNENWNLEEKEEDDLFEKAKVASAVGTEVWQTFRNAGLNPTALTSPIRVWEKEVLFNMNLPTTDDMPGEAASYAYECCHGGWIEAFKKGHWDETWDYDISSAYPYFLSRLVDTRRGHWIHAKCYGDAAFYGYALCNVTIESEFSPIIVARTKYLNEYEYERLLGESYTPTGTRQQFLTKGEIDFIHHYKLGTAEVIEGWWWLPERDPNRENKAIVVRPFKEMIEWLYEWKEHSEGLEKNIVKRIMAGCWGKLLEIRNDAKEEESLGPFLNPVWGAEVESRTRLRVAKFIIDNNLFSNLLSIAVDGVLSSRPVNCENNGFIGEWKETAHCPAFVISSGVVAVKDKEAVSEFSANYDWLHDQIQTYPNRKIYKQKKKSPMTLAKCFNLNDLSKLGQLVEIEKQIDVSLTMKRLYREEPGCGGDLLANKYESEPIDISMIKQEGGE